MAVYRHESEYLDFAGRRSNRKYQKTLGPLIKHAVDATKLISTSA